MGNWLPELLLAAQGFCSLGLLKFYLTIWTTYLELEKYCKKDRFSSIINTLGDNESK